MATSSLRIHPLNAIGGGRIKDLPGVSLERFEFLFSRISLSANRGTLLRDML
jgi:hypothetical protein